MRTWIAAIVLALVMTNGVSAECIDVPFMRLADTAEILMLARVDAAPKPSPDHLLLSVRRFRTDRPLGTCNWRLAERVDLNALGGGRSPDK